MSSQESGWDLEEYGGEVLDYCTLFDYNNSHDAYVSLFTLQQTEVQRQQCYMVLQLLCAKHSSWNFPVDEVQHIGWSQLKIQFDANVDEFWDKGIADGIYDAYDGWHIALAQWLWSILIQQEIARWKERFNAHKPHHDAQKFNPSGVAPNVTFALYEKHGGINCLQILTPEACNLIKDLKQQLGVDELLQFVSPAFAK
ncbi:hypothetical protein M422DRAFT_251928 [Sphaerobolus stellatus SS14]|uniref:Uncharacterized protein n=1 Tax=Sphaerobolus stellatus (strain SS14) TaxID=990650 RepID=A0A0C9VCC9_SPHS4|nr:hypothetical protein M422DRAFT_251928 [Sphaerobolus stellatus SS14]